MINRKYLKPACYTIIAGSLILMIYELTELNEITYKSLLGPAGNLLIIAAMVLTLINLKKNRN